MEMNPNVLKYLQKDVIELEGEIRGLDQHINMLESQRDAAKWKVQVIKEVRNLTSLGLMHEDPLQIAGGGIQGMALEFLSRGNPLAKLLCLFLPYLDQERRQQPAANSPSHAECTIEGGGRTVQTAINIDLFMRG